MENSKPKLMYEVTIRPPSLSQVAKNREQRKFVENSNWSSMSITSFFSSPIKTQKFQVEIYTREEGFYIPIDFYII